ncbi:uncharacterized protein LOC110051215 [Orbicella faveolata]|uniref:uncharacterized protein LOC110051215 n=1 Tax=Orbicella faveolata TaxID=48498 RepID=UPI0009E3E221|nr:uncharacterized protein LOC110051215 [Orbicella faveolata]
MAERLFLTHTGQDPQTWPSLQMRLGPLDIVFTILVIGLLTPGHLLFKVVLSNGRSSILLLLPTSCGVIHDGAVPSARTYSAGVQRYITFCTSRQWQSFPATEPTLHYFAAFLADQVSYRTVKLYMASIRFVHIENNLPDPFQDTPLLHLLLRGIKCSVGLSSKCCLPITMSLLWKLKTELAQAPDILPCDKLMLWSAFTLAFFAFLRSSEFTLPSTSHFNALSHLSGNDISFNSDGSLSLHLKSSKTDPYRQGCSLLIAPSGHSVCAVRAIKKYMAHHPFNSDGPFYTFQSGLYLTRAQVTSTLCLLLKRLHIPTELYASHSFRIRAATTAKNRRDKIKRQVLFRPMSKGGLSFPNFRTVIKALCLSCISRLLDNTHDTCKAIPNYYFNKHGGILFLLNCSYSVEKLDRNIPLLYRELLDYFQA